MKRVLAAAIATGGLVLASFTLAPVVHAAVTNPADNPSPITVKGDDGKTYTDGQDTLPGYDDEECTYIPGAYFDFENNRVRYADGQSIPWTEWDRATGYEAWKAKKAAAKSTTSDSAPTPSSASAPKTLAAKPKTSSTTTKSTSSKSTTAKPSASATASTSASAVPSGKPSPTDGAKAAAGATIATEAPSTSADAATAEVEEVTLAAAAPNSSAATEAVSDTSSGTGSAGLLILGGLAVVGLVTYAGYSVFGRRSRKATSS
jgi:hypothetical protein